MSAALNAPPHLRLIEGGGNVPPPWRDFPQLISGRSPFNRTEMGHYRVAQRDLQKAIENNRYQPIFDLWTYVFGQIPPVPNVSKISAQLPKKLISFPDAHACFRGVKRPVGEDTNGYDTIIFIIKPEFILERKPSLVCMIAPRPFPSDLVCAVYVTLDHPSWGRLGTPATAQSPARGIITHCQILESDARATDLPIDFDKRYRKRLW